MFVYCFDVREKIVELFEELCGARLTYNYVRPGGVAFDLPDATYPSKDDGGRPHEAQFMQRVHAGRLVSSNSAMRSRPCGDRVAP